MEGNGTASEAAAELLPDHPRAVAGGLRTFAVVAGGQFVSILGSGLTRFGLGIWVLQQTDAVSYFSLLMLAATVPGLLIAPLAGSVVDRADRRRVMLSCACASALAELVLAVLIFGGHVALWPFFVLAAVISVSEGFQEPAYMASVPLLVPKRYLGQASGLVQLSQALVQVIMPLLAALMVGSPQIGIGGVLLADTFTFLAAVLTLLWVRIPRPADVETTTVPQGSLWHDAVLGWRYLRQRSGLWALLWLFSAVNFVIGLVYALYMPLLMRLTDATTLGITMSISGSGMIVGSIAVIAIGTPRRKIRAIMALIFIGGVMIGLLGVRPWPPLIAAAGFVMMCALPLLFATSQVLWQTKVAVDVQGRVLALRRMLAQASLPAAYLVAGPLADRIFEPAMTAGGRLASAFGPWLGVGPGRGIGLMFVIMGELGCALAVVGYLYPRIRHLEDELPDMIADA